MFPQLSVCVCVGLWKTKVHSVFANSWWGVAAREGGVGLGPGCSRSPRNNLMRPPAASPPALSGPSAPTPTPRVLLLSWLGGKPCSCPGWRRAGPRHGPCCCSKNWPPSCRSGGLVHRSVNLWHFDCRPRYSVLGFTADWEQLHGQARDLINTGPPACSTLSFVLLKFLELLSSDLWPVFNSSLRTVLHLCTSGSGLLSVSKLRPGRRCWAAPPRPRLCSWRKRPCQSSLPNPCVLSPLQTADFSAPGTGAERGGGVVVWSWLVPGLKHVWVHWHNEILSHPRPEPSSLLYGKTASGKSPHPVLLLQC